MKNNLQGQSYYTDTHYMSVSRFKALDKCEFYGITEFGNTTSEAMLIGSYVDAYVEGTIEEFKELHPELFSTRGATKGELKAPYKNADNICEYIDNDSVLQQFLSGEKQVVMIGEIEGIPFKIKMDSYSKGIAINDLKVVRTVRDKQGNYIDFITPWGYDVQLAVYQEIVFQNTGERLPTFIVAVTKEDPIDSVVINVPQDYLNRALYYVQSNVKHYYEVWQGKVEPQKCGHCSACIATRDKTEIISLESLL